MNLKKSLTNPFLLVAQGFVAGAVIFFVCSQPFASQTSTDLQAQSAPIQKSVDA